MDNDTKLWFDRFNERLNKMGQFQIKRDNDITRRLGRLESRQISRDEQTQKDRTTVIGLIELQPETRRRKALQQWRERQDFI